MAQQTLNNGETGAVIRGKVNENFTELYDRTGAASESASGVVELATAAEATTGADTARAVTPAGLKAHVDAAIVAIRNGVAGAFDTLAEIATELALKAALASPTFTGVPAAPTAAAGTNTTQLATTAFVKQEQTVPAFKAHKNGSDQTGVADNTSTQITLGTEAYDVGGYFASNGWTPPAGKVALAGHYHFTGTISAGGVVIALLMKNGSPFAQWNFGATANQGAAGFYMEDAANGTDVYTFNAQVDVASGTVSILGGATQTYFCGHWISP